MKQITFSNVIAVAAILLCFYAFVGEKKESSIQKEYCILRVNMIMYTMTTTYTDGRYEVDDKSSYIKEFKENSRKHLEMAITEKIAKLANEGWLLNSEAITGHGNGYTISNEHYILERDKQ